MKANELMIGDKVMVKVLSQIPDTYVLHTWTANDYSRDIQVKPITLTPEILEKNGFVFDCDFWTIANPRYNNVRMVTYYSIGDDVADVFLGHWAFDENYAIDYVHELQHALRLCGLDELADNFKVKEEYIWKG